MQLYFVVFVLSLCDKLQAAPPHQDEVEDDITRHIDAQEWRLKAGSQDMRDDDRLLSSQIEALGSVQGRNLVADFIQGLLESFRPVIINGNDDLPPLDPINVPHIGPFTISTTWVRIIANVYNFNLEGLQWYVVDEVTFSTLRLALGVRMTLPRLTVTGSYDAFARITLLPHNAGGNFRVFVNQVEVGVDLRLGTNILGGGHLTLRQLDIKIDIHDITIRIEGLVGSNLLNSLINTVMQMTAQSLISDELETISQTLSEELFDVINEFLKNFTLDDLLG